jgi:hypothetical protein
VVPISAASGAGLPALKRSLRQLLAKQQRKSGRKPEAAFVDSLFPEQRTSFSE